MLQAHIPSFSIPFAMRCHSPVGASSLAICGETATWMRATCGELAPAYYCEAHRQSGDEPIPASYVFRRIRADATLLIAGASRMTGAGQNEAVARMDEALQRIGVIPDWLGVRSTLGRFTALPSAGQGRAVRIGG